MDEPDIQELKAQLDSFKSQLAEFQTEAQPLLSVQEQINATKYQLREAFEKQMAEIREEEATLHNKQYEIQKKESDAKWKMDRIQAQIDQYEKIQKQKAELKAKEAEDAAKAAEQAAQNAALTKRWDLLTLGAQWREWAKPHQIEGAHIITQNRKVIVADPMGLGKTLTAIAACDMVERATKDASPEFPWMGEEETYWVPAQDVWTELGVQSALQGLIADIWPTRYLLNPEYGGKCEAGEPVRGSLNYDTRNKWLNEGIIEHVEKHEETRFVNAITRPVGRKVLYICPSSLQRNVKSEFNMWAKHRNAIFVGGMTRAERAFALDMIANSDLADFVVICNYEAWRRDKSLIASFIDLEFDTLIIDEAHNAKEKKTNIWWGINEIITKGQPEYIIPMTGTPVLNRPQELFTLLQMVAPKKFTHLDSFLYSYCEQTEDGFWKFREGGLETLKKRISDHFIRRTKDQAGIILPDKTIIKHELEIDEEAYPAQAKAREQMRVFATVMIQNMTKVVDGKPKAMSAAAKIAVFTRLRQIETWPAGIIMRDPKTKEILFQLDVEESQKIDYVIRKSDDGWDGLIPEAIDDERMVLFSQFKAPLREIAKRVEAAGFKAVILDGETPESTRDTIAKDFDLRHTPDRSNSKWDIVLCNYKVGGVGLNLTAASQLIVLDEEWNPGKRDQAYDRIHRIGQTKPVTIHMIRNTKMVNGVEGGIDAWLGNIMDKKDDMVGGFDSAMTSQALDDFQEAFNSGLI